MKMRFMGAATVAAVLALGVLGCSTGKPGFQAETMRPDQQHDFNALYGRNCSACHGDNGIGGAALPLNNPVYLEWAGHDRMIGIVSNGIPHTLMPAFGYGGGGLVTDQQVEDIVHGMISHWGKPGTLQGAKLPGYAPSSAGNVARGQTAFVFYCARCHGTDGKGLSPGPYKSSRKQAAAKPESAVGSIVDPTYLSLISDQALRDIVVAGMPGENMPDWRGDAQGKPLTDQDVTDIVAWLTAHRVQFPGKPFPSSNN